MKKYLYDLIATSRKNNCTDLAIQAMPMLLHDASTGKRKYTDECTDLAALHQDYLALEAADRELLSFIGRHYDAIMEAYETQSREAFDAVVADCVAQDEEKKEEKDGADQE